MKPTRFLLFVVLLAATALRAEEFPLVTVTLSGGPAPQPATGVSQLIVLSNRSAVRIRDLQLDLFLTTPANVTFRAENHPAWGTRWTCNDVDSRHIRCHLSELPGPGTMVLVVTIDPREGRFHLEGQASWTTDGKNFTTPVASGDYVRPRRRVVTNTRDAGEGSFRAAIDAANEGCTSQPIPCAIDFDISEKPYLIQPLTPLPPITASDITITAESGSAQTRIELDGSLLDAGHGLELRGAGHATIQGLVIGGFPWDGIAVRRGPGPGDLSSKITSCRIGIRLDGSPNPNGSRAITFDPPSSGFFVTRNWLEANSRSGIFIAGGSDIGVFANFIGRNGASGVYVGPGSRDIRIGQNAIEENAHMGIAIAGGAQSVRLTNNFIENNRGLPVDHNLDGFSGYVWNSTGPLWKLPAPRIESATYDRLADTTTVTGTFDAPRQDRITAWKITLYARGLVSDEGKRQEAFITGTTFTITFPGRPPFAGDMAATADSVEPSEWSTSEYSETVAVR